MSKKKAPAEAGSAAAHRRRKAEAAAPKEAPQTLREYLEALASAQVEETTEPEEKPQPFVSFVLGAELFALPVEQVQEVLRVGPITRVPHAPSALRGVTNMRGRVLAVIDLRVRLGLEPTELGVHHRLLVVRTPGGVVGLLVDRVAQMEQVLPSTVEDAPARLKTLTTFSRGVVQRQQDLLVLLDLAPLLAPQTAA